MNKKVTIVVAGNTGGSVRRVTLPAVFLVLSSLIVVACLGLMLYVAYDYTILKNKARTVELLGDSLAGYQSRLSDQQHQIVSLARQIDEVKLKMAGLNEFEKKIRIIANITSSSDTESLFGVGGIPPEPIEVGADMGDRPNSLLREMHKQLHIMDVALAGQENSFDDLLLHLKDKRQLLASTPAIRPLNGGWVTSRFDYRKSPFTGRREFHHGLDIAAREKTPVMATADGMVLFSGHKGSLGNAIIIDHGYGMITRYGHLFQSLKKRGETVEREEIIGLVGNTGLSTGSHLHYEVRINGVPVDPEKYILN